MKKLFYKHLTLLIYVTFILLAILWTMILTHRAEAEENIWFKAPYVYSQPYTGPKTIECNYLLVQSETDAHFLSLDQSDLFRTWSCHKTLAEVDLYLVIDNIYIFFRLYQITEIPLKKERVTTKEVIEKIQNKWSIEEIK